jgi:urate oxidase
MRVSGSAFKGFVRDAYTTLPDLDDRPLHMWLDLQWQYSHPDGAIGGGVDAPAVRGIVHDVFETFRSGSIQQVIYELGTRIIRELPSIAVVDLEANNRTWDLVEERGDQCAVFTDARPPYGCLGLRLTRSASASG